jgi:hypothetical protein
MGDGSKATAGRLLDRRGSHAAIPGHDGKELDHSHRIEEVGEAAVR